MTFLETINNNTNDKQTSGASLAPLDEDSPYTNSCLFTLDRLPLLLLFRKTSSSAVQKRHSKVYGNPIAPSYAILLGSYKTNDNNIERKAAYVLNTIYFKRNVSMKNKVS